MSSLVTVFWDGKKKIFRTAGLGGIVDIMEYHNIYLHKEIFITILDIKQLFHPSPAEELLWLYFNLS